jgi:outer membrane protein assembly factor BamB
VCPGIQGGRNWPSGAYSPITGTMYFPLQNTCARYTATIAHRSEPSTYGIRVANEIAPGTQNLGSIHAISARTGQLEWKYEQRAAMLALLTTGGELLFGGDVAGRFRAFDQRTGQMPWQTNLGSMVTGFPITYAVRGRQYIAVSVGQAVSTGAYLLLTPEIRPSATNQLFVFALPEGWQVTRTTSEQRPSPPAVADSSSLATEANGHKPADAGTRLSGDREKLGRVVFAGEP